MILVAIVVIFAGQISIGSPPWFRMPGPYLVSADQRSIEPEGIDAASWALSNLGPDQRVAADRINKLLMATYGNEGVVPGSSQELVTWPLFTSPQLVPGMIAILQKDEIQFLVIDRRLSISLPVIGSYFNRGEPNAFHYTRPIDLAALDKFDEMPTVSRVFDSGDIVIYNVEALLSVPSTTLPCVPQPSSTGVSSSLPKIANFYAGVIDDIAKNQVTEMFLVGIQQQQRNLCGYFSGLNLTGTLSGTITADGHIQFVVKNQAKQVRLTFDGNRQADGMLVGSFCHPQKGKCQDYGIWSLSAGT